MRTFTKLIFTAGVAALLLAQSTRIKEAQIAVPAAASATVRVLTPTGWANATVTVPLTLTLAGGIWSLGCPSCAAGGVIFIDNETPSGPVDGVNPGFTLAAAPVPAASLHLCRNGILQKAGFDFNLSGQTISFVALSIPSQGDTLLASYRR